MSERLKGEKKSSDDDLTKKHANKIITLKTDYLTLLHHESSLNAVCHLLSGRHVSLACLFCALDARGGGGRRV